MSNQVEFELGDWSDDGHGESASYIVDLAHGKTVHDVREAHFQCMARFGFDIGDMCSDYMDDSLSYDIIECLLENEIISQTEASALEGKVTVFGLFTLWVDILNRIDPSLHLVPGKRERIPTVHFSGFDQHGRHLNVPGYGLFANY